jgi:hypothetical protein
VRLEGVVADRPERNKAKRRDFLKLVGLGSLAGAATAVAGGKTPEAKAEEKPQGAGYRETPHVRKYYDTAKF